MIQIASASMEELLQLGATYGFAGLFALLFWRFITREQKTQTAKMQTMSSQLTRIEDMLQVEELRRRRDTGRDRDYDDE